jgi:hypothetical protein
MDSNAVLVVALVYLLATGTFVTVYLFGAYVLSRIGRKFGSGTFWQYCIPVYNVVLMCRWIGLSGWVALWFYIPWLLAAAFGAFMPSAPPAAGAWLAFWLVVGPLYLAFHVYFWGTVARRLGKNFWLYGITAIVFLGVPVLFLAFDESMPSMAHQRGATWIVTRTPEPDHSTSGVSLYCVAGELANARLAIPGDGLYIGRNPSKVSLVLKSSQISNVHARVWPDRHSGGVWIEDWNSLNGTYYCPSASTNGAGRTKWKVLRGRILLNIGSRFRLGSKVVEFEVRAS